MVTGAVAVGVWCEEVEEEGAPAVRACRRSRFVAQYRAYPLQSSFSVRVRGLCYGPGFMVFAIVVDKKGRSREGSRIAPKPPHYFPRASARR